MGTDFDELKAAIRRVFPKSSLEPLSEEALAKLRRDHTGVPDHYVDFLRHVGFGRLGDSRFMFYSGPTEPADMCDPITAKTLDHILFIGDDFSETALGFDTADDWRLVWVCYENWQPVPAEVATVAAFVASEIKNHEQFLAVPPPTNIVAPTVPAKRQRTGPPCPHCGEPLATARAQQCFSCGRDWHDPNRVIRRNK